MYNTANYRKILGLKTCIWIASTLAISVIDERIWIGKTTATPECRIKKLQQAA
jgi:hypothetical protein